MPIIDPYDDAPAGIVDPYDEPAIPQDGPEKSFLSNVVESGKNYLGGIVTALTHPVETVKGMGKLAAGTAQLLYPGEQEYEKYPLAVGRDFKEAYGGIENIKNTAYKDPVRLLGDVSTVLTGGGAAAARVPGVVGRAGKIAARAGELTNPLTVAASPFTAVKKGAQAAGLPESMMGGAAKIPTGTWKLAKRDEIIGTLLKERITIREGGQGWKKLNGLIDELDNDVNAAIQAASDQGGTVRLDRLKAAVEQVKKSPKFEKSLFKNRNIREANDFVDDVFVKSLELEYPNGVIPIAEAQQLKKATYAELDEYFRALNKPASAGAATKVRNNIEAVMTHKAAKSLREEIMKQMPKDVADKLGREASLVTTKAALERALNRAGNHDILNFYDFLIAEVLTGGGMGLGAVPAVVATRAARSPAVVSKMAILLAHKSKIMNVAAPASLGIRAAGGPDRAVKSYLSE